MGEQVLGFVDDAHHRPQPQRPLGGDRQGGPLVRAQFAAQGLEPLGAAHHLGSQQPQRLGRIPDRLVIDFQVAARVRDGAR
jgi:hypothetical protein